MLTTKYELDITNLTYSERQFCVFVNDEDIVEQTKTKSSIVNNAIKVVSTAV